MCVLEARPSVLVIFFLRFVSGVLLAAPTSDSIHYGRILLAAVTWEAAILCVYLFNGVSDVVEDRLNGSVRPIARGRVSPAVALRVVVGSGTAAVLGALALGGVFLVLVMVLLGLGYVYSAPPFCLKRRLSSTSVTVIVGGLLTYAAGYLAEGGGSAGIALPVFAITMSAWMGLVGGMTKDFSDIPGDMAAGRCSGVALHERLTRVAVAVVAIVLAAMFLGVSLRLRSVLVWPAIFTQIGAVCVALLALNHISAGGRSARRRPYRAFMVTQYAAHVSLVLKICLIDVLPEAPDSIRIVTA